MKARVQHAPHDGHSLSLYDNLIWHLLEIVYDRRPHKPEVGNYDKEHKQDLAVVSSPFHAKISKNNITNLEFKCRNYNFTVRPSF